MYYNYGTSPCFNGKSTTWNAKVAYINGTLCPVAYFICNFKGFPNKTVNFNQK